MWMFLIWKILIRAVSLADTCGAGAFRSRGVAAAGHVATQHSLLVVVVVVVVVLVVVVVAVVVAVVAVKLRLQRWIGDADCSIRRYVAG